MANQTTNLDTVAASSSQKETIVNDLVNALSPSSAFGRHRSACAALTWGYYGGVLQLPSAPTVLTQVPNGTILLTASATNYLMLNASGTLVNSTVGWTSGWTPLYKVTTGSANVTDYEDFRHYVLGTWP